MRCIDINTQLSTYYNKKVTIKNFQCLMEYFDGEYTVRKQLLEDMLIRQKNLDNTAYSFADRADPDYKVIMNKYRASETFKLLNQRLEYCECIRSTKGLIKAIKNG